MGVGDNPMTPDEVSRLARLAQSGTPAEKEEAWRRLAPHIQVVARRVAGQLLWEEGPQEEFASESLTVIFERLDRYDGSRPFLPWAARVLRNWLIDAARKTKSKREVSTPLLEVIPDRSSDQSRGYETLHDFEQFFSEEDQARLELKLSPRVRVLGLTVLNLWRKVPPAKWDVWREQVGLPEDFPPEELSGYDDYNERLKALVELLNVSESSVRMALSRFKKGLLELGWIQELRN